MYEIIVYGMFHFSVVWIAALTLNLQSSVSLNELNCGSTSVDPQQPSATKKDHFPTGQLTQEWLKLSEILNKIIQSLLLSYLKGAQPTTLLTSKKK